MCYPCTMCNGCGKLDNELFAHMVPRLRCPGCGDGFKPGDSICSRCGAQLPKMPELPKS